METVDQAVGGIRVEVLDAKAIERSERVDGEGVVTRKAHRVQEVFLHTPGARYPKPMLRLVAQGEKPLPVGMYTLDISHMFVNFSWGRLEFSLRHLVPLVDASPARRAA